MGAFPLPPRKVLTMPKKPVMKRTIPGREGGLLPETPVPVRNPSFSLPESFPMLPTGRGKKEGLHEAVLSVAARVKELEDREAF